MNSAPTNTVLIPHQTGGNIYVRELGRAYAKAGHAVIYGSENLLENNVDAGLIHLQWPEELYRWRGDGAVDGRIERMFESLGRAKQNGCKIAWTVHNLAPHDHVADRSDADVYARVIGLADVTVHHCENSVKLLSERYPGARGKAHIVVPHGHYLSYPNSADPAASRRELGIPERSFVYLHFGQIRGYKGVDVLFDAFAKVRNEHKYLLIAGEYVEMSGGGAWRDRLRLAHARRFRSNIGLWTQQIPSESIQTFMNAADCVVLSHSRGLNSGVAVLGMTFGKLVVGPRIGCIGSVLDKGRNITYAAGRTDEMAKAMDQAAQVPAGEWGRDNAQVAASWQWGDIVSAVVSRLASE